jgi:hypothetical protein
MSKEILKDEEFKGGSNGKKQYGKKGSKPRSSSPRSSCNLDTIKTNDPSFWNKSKNFENVSKFVWDLIIGYSRDWDKLLGVVNFDKLLPIDFNPRTEKLNPPQVMAIDVAIGPGWCSDVNDGVNRALARVMAQVRATLSTSNIGFETADAGIYFASTSSIACNIGYAKRVLESYTIWKDRNYAYPRMLIEMMGFRYEDIRDNINQYTAKLNSLIDMYNQIGILDIFDTYERQYGLMHNVFCDEDSELGQLYIFRPANYYIYDDKNHRAQSEVTCFNGPTAFPFGEMAGAEYETFDDWLNIINEQILAWYGSSDLYQINGVFLRAFKDAPRQEIPYHEIGTQIEPVQDKAFLMQIMNMTICAIDPAQLDIIQDPTTQNFLIWKPGCDSTFLLSNHRIDTALAEKQMLRLFDTDITANDNMEMTRLMNFGRVENRGGFAFITYPNCGSEIVVRVQIAAYDTQAGAVTIGDTLTSNVINNEEIPNHEQLLGVLTHVQPFRYIPTLYVADVTFDEDDTSVEVLPYGFLGDVYNWMLYDRNDWDLLQFSAYQSLWTPKNI